MTDDAKARWRRRAKYAAAGLMLVVLGTGARTVYPIARALLSGSKERDIVDPMDSKFLAAVAAAKNGPVDPLVFRERSVIRTEVDVASLLPHVPLEPRNQKIPPEENTPLGRAGLATNDRIRQDHAAAEIGALLQEPRAMEKWLGDIVSRFPNNKDILQEVDALRQAAAPINDDEVSKRVKGLELLREHIETESR